MRAASSWTLALCALGVCACGSDTPAGAPVAAARQTHARVVPVLVTLARSEIARHGRVAVTITTRAAAGVTGDTRTNYTLAASAVRPASGCVNNLDRRFPDGPRGARVRAELDPARGEGGPSGWCLGRYRGTVTYSAGFACPAKGTCHIPKGFPTRSETVTRFSFRVR
jgi:hypothetical protein